VSDILHIVLDDTAMVAAGQGNVLASRLSHRAHVEASWFLYAPVRVSAALDFGCVWLNCHQVIPAETPHGGYKQSGIGRDLSRYGLDDYARVKHVMAAHATP